MTDVNVRDSTMFPVVAPSGLPEDRRHGPAGTCDFGQPLWGGGFEVGDGLSADRLLDRLQDR